MNKRSAIAVAGGLTGALVSGVAGYSVRVHSSAAAAAPPHTTKPIVKHQTKTITIHKKAKGAAVAHVAAAAPAVQTVVVHRAPHVVHVAPAPAPQPVVHHTGGSTHAGGGGEDQGDRGEHDGGGESD